MTEERVLHILLLEDEAVNRALVRAVLARASDAELRSARLVEAATLAEARSLLDAGQVDLAVVDVRLPDGSGLDLARELVRRERRPGIVVVSASVLAAEREAALEVGDAFLAKPYRPVALMETLRQVLDGRRRSSSP